MCRVLTKSCWHFWRGKHKYKIRKREKKKKDGLRGSGEGGGGEKLNWLSRALVKNENQSASPLFTLISAEIARNIDISIYKCTVLFRSHAALCWLVVTKCTDRISFLFFFVHKPSRLSVMDWAKAISRVWIGWQAAWKLINRNPFAGANRKKKKL